MEKLVDKGPAHSGTYDLNLLGKQGVVYIMDNHLAASCCWLREIDTNNEYRLFHIDRHYDTLNSQLTSWMAALNEQQIDLKTIQINYLTQLQYINLDAPKFPPSQLFRWDNYMAIFYGLYPGTISFDVFATHKEGTKVKDMGRQEIEIYELLDDLENRLTDTSDHKWIINLDIDYFFSKCDGKYYQLLTDEYVILIGNELRRAMPNIAVVTIALSPEMCGGWEPSIRVANVLLKAMGLSTMKL